MKKLVVKNGREWAFGYTTGSCATAASSAAAIMLFSGKKTEAVTITLPDGEKVLFKIENIDMRSKCVTCAVTKDGGDDPDVTTGAKIYATVEKIVNSGSINVSGGKGVGIVTAKGLQVEEGRPAINPVPMKMIKSNLKKIMEEFSYRGGLDVIIEVPEGEAIAKHTFNERLGIKGGISILGTTGIVEPMSEKAIIDTVKVLIDRQYAEDPDCILISPGNYGKDFCKEVLCLNIENSVTVSNFVGEALDYIRYKGFSKILLVGHTGKLVKTAIGAMNTHSSYVDGRMEVIGLYSSLCGADRCDVEKILMAVTTDEAFDIISERPYYSQVKERILERALYHLNYRLKNQVEIQVVMFAGNRNHILMSEGAEKLIKYFAEEKR